jgi:hypothetical protein
MSPRMFTICLRIAAVGLLSAGCSGGTEAPTAVTAPPISSGHAVTTIEMPTTATAATTTTYPTLTTAPPTTIAPTLSLGAAGTASFGTVTLYGVKYPYSASGAAARIKTAGKEFAVADLKVCPSSSADVDLTSFRVMTAESMSYTFWNVQIGAEDPNLVKSLSGTVAGGVCVRGFLTFEVDPGQKVSQFVVAGRSGSPLIWTLP